MNVPEDVSRILQELGITPVLLAGRSLRPFPQTTDLALADTGEDGRQHLLAPPAAAAWGRLKHSAQAAGISLFIVSAFRSVDRQAQIIRRKLAAGLRMDDILRVLAPPGFSEHHTGRAIDIGTPGVAPATEAFQDTPAFKWLVVHAPHFGFALSYPRGNPEGYQYEPWHWCHRGSHDGMHTGARSASIAS